MGDFDESLFFLIPLPFCAIPEGCLVLNYLLLVPFPQLGFIGSLFRILNNLALIGLIIVSNSFWVFNGENFGTWTFIIRSRGSCHVISISLSRLRHVSHPVHIIGPPFSTHSGTFVVLKGKMTFL